MTSLQRGEMENAEAFVAARLTPSGRGAVAVVGVAGKGAWETLCSRWTKLDGSPSKALAEAWTPESASRPLFGLFHLESPEGVADEVVLRRRTPDAFELDCHGGDLVTERVIGAFRDAGAALVSGFAWERRVEREEARLNVSGLTGTPNRGYVASPELERRFFATSEELIALTTTEETAKLACEQPLAWRGWFEKIGTAASQGVADEIVAAIDAVLKTTLGRYLTTPFTVAFIGAPNVGKSSLLNAILGYERVVASPVPGTTRDLIGVPFVYGGWNYEFVDAAGLRDTTDPIERAGIALAAELVARADVALCVYDPTRDREEQSATFDNFCTENIAHVSRERLNVLNKSDLAPEDWASGWSVAETAATLQVSAKESVGLEELLDAIFAATVEKRRAADVVARRGEPLLWLTEQETFLNRLRALCVAGRLEEVGELVKL